MNMNNKSVQKVLARPNYYQPRRKTFSTFIDNTRINKNSNIVIPNDSIRKPDKQLHQLNGK